MGDNVSKVLIFAAGAVIGSLVTWGVVKNKYERIADEEIASVKEHFFKKREEAALEEEKEEYEKIIQENSYSEPEPVEEPDDYEERMSLIHIIEPDEFAEIDDYDTSNLTLYADGTIVDDLMDIVWSKEDVDRYIGLDNLEYIGKYEEDILHIRNDREAMYYEIAQDERKYYGEIVPEE